MARTLLSAAFDLNFAAKNLRATRAILLTCLPGAVVIAKGITRLNVEIEFLDPRLAVL